MAIDPRIKTEQTTTLAPKINLQQFAVQKISEVLKRDALDKTNYQEPDDTCECTDFVTDPPSPPVRPRRREPPKPPRPPKPPILPPPLPPPPTRFSAPQLPNAIPPLIAPPPIIFPPPNIEGDGGGGGGTTEPPETTSPPDDGGVTTETPPSDGGGGGLFEDRIPCCYSGPLQNASVVTDIQLALGAEESTHSGEFRNGCYPMCGLEKYREFLSSGAGFCDRTGIQICKCYARNAPYNPCYEGNGQVSPPGANITSTAILKKLILPAQYTSPSDYYQANLTST